MPDTRPAQRPRETRRLLPRLQTIANVVGVALLVWLTAPLVVVGGRHPFEATAPRLLLLGALALLALAAWATQQWLRRRRNAKLFDQLQAGHPASEVLAQRFANAMHLLRSGIAASDARPRWWQRQRQVYQLPWYLFIGAPGAGKTTALLHSGLRFPLAERMGSAPVAGIGGTRQCDWWFTDQAVFIDTAGRYTTQDSHAATDAREWQTFLRLLRRHRPVQPINGIIVTVSVPDLLQGGAELGQQAAAVDRRLQELRAELGMSFPVYLLVTKADLLAGFVEFFGDFDAAQREQMWGIGLDLPPSGDAPALPTDLAARLATLPQRIAAMTTARLQAEPLLQRRAAIYHFVAQVEALLPALENFARQAFRSAAVAPPQRVRGIHLSSGTQEGNPIDRVLGELSRSFGVALRAPVRAAEGGKAYFLAGLLKRFVIAEAPLAGNNLARQRLRRRLLATGGITVGVAMLLACAAWIVSYQRNVAYVEAVRERVDKVTREVGPSGRSRVDQLLPLYGLLSELGASGTIDPHAAAPWGSDFGLFQGPRLARSADQTYHRVLDATLAPQIADRLNAALRQDSDPVARYEALRIALMLAQPARLQRAEVRRWAAQAFSAPAPAGGAAPGVGEQQEWLRHLDALLERNALQQVLQIDEAAVRSARSALAALPIEQRAHDRLIRRARETFPGTRSLGDLAGAGAVLAFAAQELPTVPVIYTRQAWIESIDPALEPILAALAAEADWVLDDRSPATQRLVRDRAAREPIARQVALRHAQAVRTAWDKLLGAIALPAPPDGEALARLATQLATADSPMRQLQRRLAAEFPAPRPADAAGVSPATAAYDTALAETFASLRDYATGPGATAPDRLMAPLAAALNDPARVGALGREMRTEAASAPPPWREFWAGFAEATLAQQRRAQERQIGGGIAELAQACRRLTAERFPFADDAKRDMPYADFARVFGPQGLFDSFVRTRLAGIVDTQRRPWRFTADAPGGEKAQAALRSFEMADDIRRLFFAGGTTLPQLRLQLTPAAMDAELLMFSADVDGQMLRYENGPRRAKAVTWPGPAATQRVVLRILPAGPSGVGAEVHEGPWALLRVLQRRGGAASTSRLTVDGRTLAVDVATEVPAGARLLDELARFRCPEAW